VPPFPDPLDNVHLSMKPRVETRATRPFDSRDRS
jgi:hypothetical protein